jgi:3-hydroxymyristoyl/3-hydroxydecanoyl-(acyl carrier protein) dehydratase
LSADALGKPLKHIKKESKTVVLFPEILGEKQIDDGIVLALRIPEELAYFNGHFDEVHVVPGVAQIQWAIHFARQYLKISGLFSHMEAIKFKEILLPKRRLELILRYLSPTNKLDFCYRSETVEYSSGRIYFHGEPL